MERDGYAPDINNRFGNNAAEGITAANCVWELLRRGSGGMGTSLSQAITPVEPTDARILAELRNMAAVTLMYEAYKRRTSSVQSVATPFNVGTVLVETGNTISVTKTTIQLSNRVYNGPAVTITNGDDAKTVPLQGSCVVTSGLDIPNVTVMPTFPVLIDASKLVCAFTSYQKGRITAVPVNAQLAKTLGIDEGKASDSEMVTYAGMLTEVLKPYIPDHKYNIKFKEITCSNSAWANLFYLIMCDVMALCAKNDLPAKKTYLDVLGILNAFVRKKGKKPHVRFLVEGGTFVMEKSLFYIPTVVGGKNVEWELVDDKRRPCFPHLPEAYTALNDHRSGRGVDNASMTSRGLYADITLDSAQLNIAYNCVSKKGMFDPHEDVVLRSVDKSQLLHWLRVFAASDHKGDIFVSRITALEADLLMYDGVDDKCQRYGRVNSTSSRIFFISVDGDWSAIYDSQTDDGTSYRDVLPKKDTKIFDVDDMDGKLETDFLVKAKAHRARIKDRLRPTSSSKNIVCMGSLVDSTDAPFVYGNMRVHNLKVFYSTFEFPDPYCSLKKKADVSRYLAWFLIANARRTGDFVHKQNWYDLCMHFGIPYRPVSLSVLGKAKLAKTTGTSFEIDDSFGIDPNYINGLAEMNSMIEHQTAIEKGGGIEIPVSAVLSPPSADPNNNNNNSVSSTGHAGINPDEVNYGSFDL